MRNILKGFVFFSVILLPLQSFCSYISDSNSFWGESMFVHIINRKPDGIEKCHLLIDMISETTNEDKKNQLKTILEVEVLVIKDKLLWQIEYLEGCLADADESTCEPSLLQSVRKHIEWIKLQSERLSDLMHTL